MERRARSTRYQRQLRPVLCEGGADSSRAGQETQGGEGKRPGCDPRGECDEGGGR